MDTKQTEKETVVETEFDIYEDIVIKAKPVFSYKECIAALCKARGKKKSESMNLEEASEFFPSMIYQCDKEKLDFLKAVIEQTNNKTAMDKAGKFPLRIFLHQELIFIFESEGKRYLVLPTELQTVFESTIQAADFAERNARNLRLNDVTISLLNLYGAFPVEQFVEVWNQHYKDKLTQGEAERFLSDNEIMSFEYNYEPDGEFAFAEHLEYEEAEEILDQSDIAAEQVGGYFMPTKTQLKRCYDIRYDYDLALQSPERKAMTEFLAKHRGGVSPRVFDEIDWYMEYSCSMRYSPAEIAEFLEEYEMPLGNAEFVKKFESLYNKLMDNTHIWPLAGYTASQFRMAGGQITPFRLPTKKESKGKKKR